MSCLLRRNLYKDSNIYAIPAGLIASMAFMAYPSNVIALYFMWKTLQVLLLTVLVTLLVYIVTVYIMYVVIVYISRSVLAAVE